MDEPDLHEREDLDLFTVLTLNCLIFGIGWGLGLQYSEDGSGKGSS